MLIHYNVVFEVTQKGFDWGFPAAGTGFVIVGLILAWVGSRGTWKRGRKIGYILIGFGLAWTVAVVSTTVREYVMMHRAYKNGHYLVVEGQVENFHPMPYEGHQQECFSVKQITFCYSNFERTAGFNNAASHGGPIKPGLPVRIAYVGGHILRLEVGEE